MGARLVTGAALAVFAVVSAVDSPTATATAVLERLGKASEAIEAVLTSLNSRWHIHTHPNFLRSVSMSQISWDVLKLKYMSKILDASSAPPGSVKFVIGFMGSSVTAGHDSPFNSSFPVQTGDLLAPAFATLGITVASRNAAMGNNPCVPFDLCPRTYAGPDADIVHWEQSFNCFGSDAEKRDVFEGFLRQSIGIASQPIVVFTTSDTPNWPKKDCDGKDPEARPNQSPEDKKALEYLKHGKARLIPSEVNKNGPAMKPWSAMLDLFRQYQTRAGVQVWDHASYAEYKCTGPYLAEWQNQGVASWHPSLLGHELRAAHYAYFWLLILQDAVAELKKNLTGSAAQSLPALGAQIKKHIEVERKHVPSKPLYPTLYSDNMQCLTTYEPKHDPEANLKARILTPPAGGKPWTGKIFEEMTDPGILTKARSRGYLDFKHMLYGNKENAPLSIKISIGVPGGGGKGGTGFLCQPPGNWGKLPNGFRNFWEVDTQVFLTTNVVDYKSFEFSSTGPNTKMLRYTNRKPKDTQTICVDFAPFIFPPGQHVLTVVPVSEANIMVSTILLPAAPEAAPSASSS